MNNNPPDVQDDATTVVATVSFEQPDPMPRTPPNQHYHMSQSKRNWVHIQEFLRKSMGDLATKVIAFSALAKVFLTYLQ